MNGVGGPYVDPSQPPAPQAATSDYPPCSRTVTDHCIQTYERGVGHAVRRHRYVTQRHSGLDPESMNTDCRDALTPCSWMLIFISMTDGGASRPRPDPLTG